MTRLLLLCEEYPSDPTNGQHLRIHALCRELDQIHECYFVAMEGIASNVERGHDLHFIEQVYLPPRTREVRSWKRHFRLSNSRFLQQSSPAFFRTTVSEINGLAKRWGINALINFSPPISEVAVAIDLPMMLDYPDSSTLTMTRSLMHSGRNMALKRKFITRVQLRRQIARERYMLNSFKLTTTIAEPDRKMMLEVSGIEPDRIVVVPNGVNSDLLQRQARSTNRTRSIVFWGNLDFPPNWTAIVYFYKEIFLPYLAEQGVEWHIVGKGPGRQIAEIAKHPLIRMEGFQEDLASFVADKGVMINPMIEGSGLKNKVLEAFALRIPVVSTSLGVEAINGETGEHFLVADVPESFARLVVQLLDDENLAHSLTEAANRLVSESYTWRAVGRQFEDVVQRLL